MEKDTQVNIPRSVADSHYRYKMPVLLTKVEGRGNGIKTRLTNVTDIAKALDRSATYIVKFFGFELGTQIIFDDTEFLINGKHEPGDLANLLDRFIEKYVLCRNCQNPETTLFIKRDAPKMRCKACGHITDGDVSHKIANYICKFPPEDTVAKKNSSVDTEEDIFGSNQNFGNEDELQNDWAVSTDPGEVAKRQYVLFGNLASSLFKDVSTTATPKQKTDYQVSPILKKISPTENPLPIMEEYWESMPTDGEVMFNISQISRDLRWTEDALLKNIFASMWLNFKSDGAVLKAHYLSLFVQEDNTDSKQKQILRHMETMAADSKSFALRFADILTMFWEERVLEVEIIKKWYTHPNPKIPEKVSKFVRNKSAPVMAWLENESDGEDLPLINEL